jgi:anti-sigma factor RsiW
MVCDRAREWATLEVDGELSQFELAFLRTHLERCAACSDFADEIRGIAGALRAAPPEPLERPVTLPARRRTALSDLQLAGAAALVLAAIGLGALSGSLPSPERQAGGPQPITRANLSDLDEGLRRLRLASLQHGDVAGPGPQKPILFTASST